ncbi:MAG: hypothetical protein GVY15_06380 [Bacteroidetes bacterium]|jgi:hypothetical protein|nr:hypothetical protein [Bacteroidota bacterium]
MHALPTEAVWKRTDTLAVRRGPDDTGGTRNGSAGEAPLVVVAERLPGRPVVRSVFPETDRRAHVNAARMAALREPAIDEANTEGPVNRVACRPTRRWPPSVAARWMTRPGRAVFARWGCRHPRCLSSP